MDEFEDRAIGCLGGSAVGDAIGGATEGWTQQQINERWGGPVKGIVGPYHLDWRHARPASPYHKGDGHITDDTLMTHALVRVYEKVGRHLDAFGVDEHLVAEMIDQRHWIPELETDAVLLQRVFLAEKWLVLRLHYGHNDPREAGVGNLVNCGAAMYIAPVGIVNAGDPRGAYDEAIDMAGAHQSSYGREAAGVLAAAVAEALGSGASVDSVIEAALDVAKDGTAHAIRAVVDRARMLPAEVISDAFGLGIALREAVLPFDTVGPVYRSPAMDSRKPSRTKAIEELPVALGMVVAARGDYRTAVLGAVNYGRDADSIASMAGSICGSLGGSAAIPAPWLEDVATASRMDLIAPGKAMAAVARRIAAADRDSWLVRSQRRAASVTPAGTAAPATGIAGEADLASVGHGQGAG
ncbi:ADP-ribosylglycohydrolase [Nakamurella sp. UYEF19]|uniref:ADP-ribosylglycohydrolase family protein n=1 Tax=Nakamurella sp. UYEF19 TaxID=1756392 RepID=UPI003392F3F2